MSSVRGLDPQNADVALFGMQGIKTLDDQFANLSLRDHLAESGLTPDHLALWGRTAHIPEMAVAYFGDLAMVFVAGARTLIHTADCVQSYFTAPDPADFNRTARVAYTQAGVMIGRINEEATEPLRDVLVFGHSYGGWLSLALAVELSSQRPTLNYAVATFGSPKSLTPRGLSVARDDHIAMWQCSRDPVPWLLPTSGDGAPVNNQSLPTTLFGNLPCPPGREREFIRPTNWRILADTGDAVTPSNAPEPTPQFATLNILEWATGVQGLLNPAHTAQHYCDLLRRRVSGPLRDLGQRLSLGTPGGTTEGGDWGGDDALPPVELFSVPAVSGAIVQGAMSPTLPEAQVALAPVRARRLAIVVGGIQVGVGRSRSHRRRCETQARRLALLARGAAEFDYKLIGSALARQAASGTLGG